MTTNSSIPHPAGRIGADRVGVEEPAGSAPLLLIDCDQCILQDTDACRDCIVTFLCGAEADEPVLVDLAEARAMRLLGEAGLAPPLRHRHRAG